MSTQFQKNLFSKLQSFSKWTIIDMLFFCSKSKTYWKWCRVLEMCAKIWFWAKLFLLHNWIKINEFAVKLPEYIHSVQVKWNFQLIYWICYFLLVIRTQVVLRYVQRNTMRFCSSWQWKNNSSSVFFDTIIWMWINRNGPFLK